MTAAKWTRILLNIDKRHEGVLLNVYPCSSHGAFLVDEGDIDIAFIKCCNHPHRKVIFPWLLNFPEHRKIGQNR